MDGSGKKSWTDNIDRVLRHPLILVLCGSVFVSVFTSVWASREQRELIRLQYERVILEKQFEVLENVSEQYRKTATHLNHWFEFLISASQESIKPAGEFNVERLEFCRQSGEEAHGKYMEQESFWAILDQIIVLFRSEKVHDTGKEMDVKWGAFGEKVNAASRHYNSGKVTAEDINEWNDFRIKTIDELNRLKNELTEQMRNEIVTAHKSYQVKVFQ